MNKPLNQLVRHNEKDWLPLSSISEDAVPGVYVKTLRFDETTGRAPTILLKFDAGARYPLHTHPGGEEVFVLEGDIHLGGDHLFAGDYLFTAPDNVHAVRSDGGCVVFLKAPQATVFVERR